MGNEFDMPLLERHRWDLWVRCDRQTYFWFDGLYRANDICDQ